MDCPLIGTGGKAIAGQIGAIADAHAGVANQQKNIATRIIAVEEFLLEKLILLCRERAWESLRQARKILAADQVNEFSKQRGSECRNSNTGSARWITSRESPCS